MSRALLIGGAGFIGRHLVQQYASAGFDVRVADVHVPAVSERPAIAMSLEYVAVDFHDPLALQAMLADVDVVVLLAHQAMLLGLNSSMIEEIERNVIPAVRLFDACLSANISKIVFVSSGGTIYGDVPAQKPIDESVRTAPISMYGVSKVLTEQVARLYAVQRNLQLVTVRPGNAYGSGQKPFKGQGLVATVMASVLAGKPVTIYGDGSIVRDYIHATDIAAGIVAVSQSGCIGEAYNLGTGVGTSIKSLIYDFIQPVVAKEGYSLQVDYVANRGVDVAYNVLDCQKVKSHCGFTPLITLEQGIEETWCWLKHYLSNTGTQT